MIKLNRLDKVAQRTLKRVQNASERPRTQGYDLNEKFANFTTRLDVRGQRAEEVLPRLMGFVDEASVFGADELRIVHGKGNGVLREVVLQLPANPRPCGLRLRRTRGARRSRGDNRSNEITPPTVGMRLIASTVGGVTEFLLVFPTAAWSA